MIATLHTAASAAIGTLDKFDAFDAIGTTTAGRTGITGMLETILAGTDLHREGTDLVIDELDQWRNAKEAVAGFSTQTFNLVVVPGM